MSDFLATGSAWLSGVFNEHVSKSVVYKRGTASVNLTVTIGRSEVEIIDQNQQLVKSESRDYIFDVSSLVLSSQTVTPQAGDLIEETVGEETWKFSVMPPVPRGEPWRYSDPYHKRYRVHTKRIS